MKIDPDVYYSPISEELRQLAAVQTLARWRHEGRGPAFIKSGSRVLYLGADVLAWLAANRVVTDGAPEAQRSVSADRDARAGASAPPLRPEAQQMTFAGAAPTGRLSRESRS